VISIDVHGGFDNVEKFLRNGKALTLHGVLNRYGALGVAELQKATPRQSGKTAASWTYEIHGSQGTYKIVWRNTSTTSTGIPIVVLLQYGHGNGNGGYVQGRDFINPAMRPVFNKIAEDAWKEIKRL